MTQTTSMELQRSKGKSSAKSLVLELREKQEIPSTDQIQTLSKVIIKFTIFYFLFLV